MIYYATISHHSIGRARVVEIEGTLAQAKRRATAEFDGENLEYRIVIYTADGETVASRLVADKRWAQ